MQTDRMFTYGALAYLDYVVCLLLLLEKLQSLLLHNFLLLLFFLLQALGFLIKSTSFTLDTLLSECGVQEYVVLQQFPHLKLLLLVHLHLLMVLFLLLARDLLIGSLLSIRHALPLLPSNLTNLQ